MIYILKIQRLNCTYLGEEVFIFVQIILFFVAVRPELPAIFTIAPF